MVAAPKTYLVCVIKKKKGDVGSVEDRLEEYKHRNRRPVKGHHNCSGCVNFKLNGLIFVARYEY